MNLKTAMLAITYSAIIALTVWVVASTRDNQWLTLMFLGSIIVAFPVWVTAWIAGRLFGIKEGVHSERRRWQTKVNNGEMTWQPTPKRSVFAEIESTPGAVNPYDDSDRDDLHEVTVVRMPPQHVTRDGRATRVGVLPEYDAGDVVAVRED